MPANNRLLDMVCAGCSYRHFAALVFTWCTIHRREHCECLVAQNVRTSQRCTKCLDCTHRTDNGTSSDQSFPGVRLTPLPPAAFLDVCSFSRTDTAARSLFARAPAPPSKVCHQAAEAQRNGIPAGVLCVSCCSSPCVIYLRIQVAAVEPRQLSCDSTTNTKRASHRLLSSMMET